MTYILVTHVHVHLCVHTSTYICTCIPVQGEIKGAAVCLYPVDTQLGSIRLYKTPVHRLNLILPKMGTLID